MVRIWIKRANDRYDKTCGRTGSSGDDLLNEFQTACRHLQRSVKGDEYMDGIASVQPSGTDKITTSTPKIAKRRMTTSTITSSSKPSTVTTLSTVTTPSTAHTFDSSDVQSDAMDDCQNLNIPKPSKRTSESMISDPEIEMVSNPNKNQIMQSFCDNQKEDNILKRQQLELEQRRFDFEREKWSIEKKLIEKSIEEKDLTIKEKQYKSMYYYLKCHELFRSDNLSVREINQAHELFQVPLSVEYEEVFATDNDPSFAESVSSSNDDKKKR